jgi:predicted RND superfamily exporter protein
MIATVVDWEALLDVVVASLAVGIGVTITFSLSILGTTRFAEMRRDHRRAEEIAYGTLAGVGLAVTLAAVVFGIVVMTSK